MTECYVVVCSVTDGVTSLWGPFRYLGDAERWLEKYPLAPGKFAKIIDLDNPDGGHYES